MHHPHSTPRRPRQLLLSALCALTLLAQGLPAAAQAASSYQQPSAAVRELLDAPNLPRQLISPDRQTLAQLGQRRLSNVEELARPMLRLAGLRFDPGNASPQAGAPLQSLSLRPLLDPQAPEREISLPAGGAFHAFHWSPDGKRFLLTRRTPQATELWVGETAGGALRQIKGLKLNLVLAPLEPVWLSPNEFLVLAVPASRGAAPTPPKAPSGPTVQESFGRNSPERTYPDLLKNSFDQALLDYHARSQITAVNLATGALRALGEPGLFSALSSSGEGAQTVLLSERLSRPFSYSLPWEDFPRTVELRSRDGAVLRELAKVPLKQGVVLEGVVTGPRAFFAAPGKNAAVFWVEALDGGNPNTKAPHRDRLMRLDPPFKGEAQEVQRLAQRFVRLSFLDDGQNALLTELDRQKSWLRTSLQPLAGGPGKTVFDHSLRERYRHPGVPQTRMLANGRQAVIAAQGELLLAGPGASPQGERPFLDRLSLKDLSVQRLFQSDENAYEQALLVLDKGRLLTQRESANQPPQLILRSGAGFEEERVLTQAKDPSPQLRKIRRELITFKRADGVDLSFWLYLPPDYRTGERRPALAWAYPLEYTDASTAGQVSGSANRFTSISPLSPLMLLMDGFVVLSDATMPVVGDPKTVNDSFVEQITMNARAIIDKAEELGVVDPKRMAVGGHSYGAFMTANLLAHTKLFKTGIARSGAYNRTLTPFGFQSERRSLWEAQDVYLKLSPFLYANQIKEPLLLIHGEADNNSGTFPMQSERLYQALAGTGGSVRYVTLPFESHGYTARESVGHVQWEMSQWLKTQLGDPRAPR
ncbi:prolyl oligopeptidase family serine peptidase [Paucibacter sp. KBW04]|uniref:S9 family peptidase n=1 Tax=Paucibacter sp. KBW04 TaxID=2153361 RepID=UPI000F579B32|nr:prolyl oligopeptidase family serine peptidase [Paucibacter sp. KBW04]